MRRVAALLSLALMGLVACAEQDTPPGGTVIELPESRAGQSGPARGQSAAAAPVVRSVSVRAAESYAAQPDPAAEQAAADERREACGRLVARVAELAKAPGQAPRGTPELSERARRLLGQRCSQGRLPAGMHECVDRSRTLAGLLACHPVVAGVAASGVVRFDEADFAAAESEEAGEDQTVPGAQRGQADDPRAAAREAAKFVNEIAAGTSDADRLRLGPSRR